VGTRIAANLCIVFGAWNNQGNGEKPMKSKLALAALVTGALLAPALSQAADDQDADRSNPKVFVKDSVITTKIKAKLAAEKPSSLTSIHVDTDANGVVWLSGTAKSQDQIDKAVSIARATENVREVKSNVKVKADS
jgi:hyperosmotically inducible protein